MLLSLILALYTLFFETEFHYVTIAGLELATQTRLALNSQKSAHLGLRGATIKSVHHHTWLLLFSYLKDLYLIMCMLLGLCGICECSIYRGQKSVFDNLVLELQTMESSPV